MWGIFGPNWPTGARAEVVPIFKGYRIDTDKKGRLRARKVQFWTLDEARNHGHGDKIDILIEYYERRATAPYCKDIAGLFDSVWEGPPQVVLVPSRCWGAITWDLTL